MDTKPRGKGNRFNCFKATIGISKPYYLRTEFYSGEN